ncbi:hypothetical protein CsSME_00004208 [Camellia sinensis var. sinensis]
MIIKGYKQTLKTRRRLSFSISVPSLHFTSLSNLLVGGSSGGLGPSDIGLRSVDQSDPFYHHKFFTITCLFHNSDILLLPIEKTSPNITVSTRITGIIPGSVLTSKISNQNSPADSCSGQWNSASLTSPIGLE